MALSMMKRSTCSVQAPVKTDMRCSRSRLVVRASRQQDKESVNIGHAALAATITASMLIGAQMVVPSDALAARTGGRAGASSFKSRRAAAGQAPSINSYSSTTIIAPPPVIAPPIFAAPILAPPPVILAPPPISPFGVNIVVPIPLPNPFASPAPPAPTPAVTAESVAVAEATAAATAAAAAATAAAAAATAAVAAK